MKKIQASVKQRTGKNNKRKLRILHIIGSLAIGGAEGHVVTYANTINKSRFEVYVNYGAKNTKDEALVDRLNKDVKLIIFKTKKVGSLLSVRHLPHNLRHILLLYKIIKQNKIDLVHTYDESLGLRAWIAAKLAGVTTVYSPMHTMVPKKRYEQLPLKYKWLGKSIDKLITKYIAGAGYMKKRLIAQKNIPEKKISVQYIGINMEKYNPSSNSIKVRDALELGSETPVIGIVARLSPEKGIHKAIKAFPYVIKEVPEARLLIVGDGPLRDELEQMCITLGVADNVIFTGFRHDVDQLMKVIDIYLQTTDAPCVGITTLEAMATGKPLITVVKDEDEREMASETLIDSENGFIVPDIPERIAEKIVFLIRNKDVAREQGRVSLQLVEEKFDLKKNIDSLEKLYESLVIKR